MKINCEDKIRHKTKIEAEQALYEFELRRIIFYTPMNVYECPKHKCWHLGHKYKWTIPQRKKYNKIMNWYKQVA